MNEIYEIGETVATTSEYTEVLTLIYNELLVHTDYLSGIYAMGWVLAGCITALAILMAVMSIVKQ